MKDTKWIITDVLNEDGTVMCYPKNPLEEKWDKLYPPVRNWRPCYTKLPTIGDETPLMNYSCVLCDEKCRHNGTWDIPEEDKEVYAEYVKKVLEYDEIHNPKLYAMRMESGKYV